MRLDNIEPADERETAPSEEQSPRTAVLVLGTPRSGIDELGRMLGILGCDMPAGAAAPDDDGAAPAEEAPSVGALNDRILASAGSAWDDWTRFNPRWFESVRAGECRAEADRILAEDLGGSFLFALADPRICRFPRFWTEAIEAAGARPVAVITLRSPLQVAAALEAEHGFEPRLGQLIWLRNVLDAEHGTRGLSRSFTSYDDLMEGWNAVARKVEGDLGVVWPRLSDSTGAEIEEHLAPDPSHRPEPDARVAEDLTLPDWLRRTYEILSRWVRSGEDEGDHEALDAIRAEFDTAAPAFARLIASGHRAAEQARVLEHRLDEAAGRERALEQRLAEMAAERDAAKASTAERGAEAERLGAELDRQREAQAALEQRLEEAGAQVEEAQRAREQAEANMKYSDAALDTARREAASRLDELQQLKDRLGEGQGSAPPEDLAKAEAARAEAEALANSYREHVALLLEDGRRQAREVVELRRQQAEAVDFIGRTVVALALGRKWPRLGRLQARLAARRLRRSGFFDAEWYRAQNDDVAEAGLDPVVHYLMHGAAEGRAPNPLLALDPRRKLASDGG